MPSSVFGIPVPICFSLVRYVVIFRKEALAADNNSGATFDASKLNLEAIADNSVMAKSKFDNFKGVCEVLLMVGFDALIRRLFLCFFYIRKVRICISCNIYHHIFHRRQLFLQMPLQRLSE